MGLSAAGFVQSLRAGSFSLDDVTGGLGALQTDVTRQVAFAANMQWAIFEAMGNIKRDPRSPTGYSIGRVVVDPAINPMLTTIAEPLFASSSRRDLNWRVGLFNDPGLSAFTYGAGVVMLSSGLIALCDREETLAGVIAHETGHIDHGHLEQSAAARALLNQRSLNDMLSLGSAAPGDVVEFLADLTSISYRGYKRLQENEADAFIVRAFRQAGYDVQQSDACSKMLVRYGAGHGTPDEVNCLYQSHPQSLERLERVQAIQATYSNERPPYSSGLFDEFKERVATHVAAEEHARLSLPAEKYAEILKRAQNHVLRNQGF